MRPKTVLVRSSETGNVFPIRADMADQPTLTVVTETEATADEYESHTVPELRALIAARNETREDDNKIPSSGTKAELVAALVADDNPASQADTE